MKRILMFSLLFLMLGIASSHCQDVPAFDRELHRVQDHAALLTAEERDHLNHKLVAFDSATGIKMIVATTTDRHGFEMVKYTQMLFDAWGPGEKGLDNGIIVHLSMDSSGHKVRIHTGYGIEADLPDITCKQIIRSAMIGKLNEHQYFSALDAGVQAIIDHLGPKTMQQHALDKERTTQTQTETTKANLVFLITIVVFLAIFFCICWIIFRIRYRRRTRAEIAQLADKVTETNNQARQGLAEALRILALLRKSYPKTVWEGFGNLQQRVDETIGRSDRLIGQANELGVSYRGAALESALDQAKDALRVASQALDLVNSVHTKVSDIEKAQQDAPELVHRAEERIETASGKVAREKVKQPSKDKLEEARESLAQAKQMQGASMVDWLLVVALLGQAVALANQAERSSDEDLRPKKKAQPRRQSPARRPRDTEEDDDGDGIVTGLAIAGAAILLGGDDGPDIDGPDIDNDGLEGGLSGCGGAEDIFN